jgi:hypothetical protein
MPITLDGTNGITQADQFNSDSTFGFKNRIIDGGFTINQRGYVSGTSLSSGSYGHDRWKGGASGGTYTFTQASAGVNTTITITAGTIIQVIEGANLPEGGTYVLSWTGTAQGKIGAGSFGASGITGTITAGTDTNIEFNTGTCGNVQLEVGSTATSFDYRPYGTELNLCYRYYYQLGGDTAYQSINTVAWYTTADGVGYFSYPVTMRIPPNISKTGTWVTLGGGGTVGQTLSADQLGNKTVQLGFNSGSGGTSGQASTLRANNDTSLRVTFNAEL